MAEGYEPRPIQLIETSENNVIAFTHPNVTGASTSANQFGSIMQISINALSTSATISNWTVIGALSNKWRPKTAIVVTVSNGGFLYIATNGDILTLGSFPETSNAASTAIYIGN